MATDVVARKWVRAGIDAAWIATRQSDGRHIHRRTFDAIGERVEDIARCELGDQFNPHIVLGGPGDDAHHRDRNRSLRGTRRLFIDNIMDFTDCSAVPPGRHSGQHGAQGLSDPAKPGTQEHLRAICSRRSPLLVALLALLVTAP
jgi:hypothetical protein